MDNVCIEIRGSVYEYLDMELSLEEEVSIGEHLADCEECRIRYEFEAEFLWRIRDKCRAIRAPDRLRWRISALIDQM